MSWICNMWRVQSRFSLVWSNTSSHGWKHINWLEGNRGTVHVKIKNESQFIYFIDWQSSNTNEGDKFGIVKVSIPDSVQRFCIYWAQWNCMQMLCCSDKSHFCIQHTGMCVKNVLKRCSQSWSHAGRPRLWAQSHLQIINASIYLPYFSILFRSPQNKQTVFVPMVEISSSQAFHHCTFLSTMNHSKLFTWMEKCSHSGEEPSLWGCPSWTFAVPPFHHHEQIVLYMASRTDK